MRKIFTAPDYAPIVAMRGGIGLGTMKSKVMRDRLQYLKRKKEGQWGTRTSAPKTSGEDGGGEEFSAWGEWEKSREDLC